MNAYAKRVDGNQAEIVRALEAVGASVQSLAGVGRGVPDLLVGFRGANHLLEVKNHGRPPSKRRLRETQAEWHSTWRGRVSTVENVDQALAAIGAVVFGGRP